MKHVQRKRFATAQLASEAANGFDMYDINLPGVQVTANVRKVNDEFWLYVTSVGELVTDDAMLLPGYEIVT